MSNTDQSLVISGWQLPIHATGVRSVAIGM